MMKSLKTLSVVRVPARIAPRAFASQPLGKPPSTANYAKKDNQPVPPMDAQDLKQQPWQNRAAVDSQKNEDAGIKWEQKDLQREKKGSSSQQRDLGTPSYENKQQKNLSSDQQKQAMTKRMEEEGSLMEGRDFKTNTLKNSLKDDKKNMSQGTQDTSRFGVGPQNPQASSSAYQNYDQSRGQDSIKSTLNDAMGDAMKGTKDAMKDTKEALNDTKEAIMDSWKINTEGAMNMVTGEVAPIDEEIVTDHNELKSLHKKFKDTGDVQWYNQYIWELSRHSIAEELVFYPVLDKLDHTARDKRVAEHHKAKELAVKIEKMEKPSAEFSKAFDELHSEVLDHATVEENQDLAKLKSSASRDERITMARLFQFRKKIVPTRPHTAIPEVPAMLNEAMGLMMAPIDKFRDLFREFPDQKKA